MVVHTIMDDALRRVGLHDIGEVRVQYAVPFVVLTVHYPEMASEVFDDSIVIVSSVTE